jgi:hypothetical protein
VAEVAVASVTVVPLNAAMVSLAGIHDGLVVSEICIPTSAAVIPVVEVTDVLLDETLPLAVVIVAGVCSHFRRNKWPVLSTKATWEPSRESVTEVGIVSEVL